MGVILALSDALFCSVWVTVRILVARDISCTYLMLVLYGFVGTVSSGVWATLFSSWRIPETISEFTMFVLYAIVVFFQTLVGLESLKYEESKSFFISSTLSVGLSYVIQITVFGETVDLIRVCGVLIIITCVALHSWESKE